MKDISKLGIVGVWQEVKIIAEANDFIVILGTFNGEESVLGMAWTDNSPGFPSVHGRLSPIVVPSPFREFILNALPSTGVEINKEILEKAKKELC